MSHRPMMNFFGGCKRFPYIKIKPNTNNEICELFTFVQQQKPKPFIFVFKMFQC